MGTLQGTNKYPIPVGTFESMIFGTSAGGICDPSLEGNLYGMGVSKNRGTPKYMVYKGKTLFKMDDLILGVPLVSETSNMGVSENGGTPKKHPKMIIFSRKTHGCWGTTIFGNIQKNRFLSPKFLPKNSLAGAEGLRWILARLHPRPWRSPCERGPLWSHPNKTTVVQRLV